LAVIADAQRMAELRHALRAWPVPVALSVATSAMAAMRLMLVQPSRLVVVDWAIDGPDGQALVRQLARLRPDLQVLAFDLLDVRGPADRVLAWPWHERSPVLDRWVALEIARERAATGRP
jgi:DNA-binding NarL/FixJ family response regulator